MKPELIVALVVTVALLLIVLIPKKVIKIVIAEASNVLTITTKTEPTEKTTPGPATWSKIGNGSCVNEGNEYNKEMYSHDPPYFITSFENCKKACESNASNTVMTEICTGINFGGIGQCSQLARSPWVSPNKNVDTDECWYYGGDKPNGLAQLKITPDR